MKKLVLIFSLIIAFGAMTARAQFSENFNGVTVNSQGIGSLPAGWTQYNLDGLTPYSSYSWMGTNAWMVAKISGGRNVAVSTSWFTPAGTANRWMVTPHITVPAAHPFLTFTAATGNPGYPDGYAVMISTATNAVADFTTTLLTVLPSANADTTFRTQAIDLAAYSGQQVYIAFINNTHDGVLLFIDDIQVFSNTIANDVQLTSVSIDNYLLVNSNATITGTFKNLGYAPVTGLTVNWTDPSTQTQTLTGLNVPTQGSYTFTLPFSKSTVDEFNINVTLANPNGMADPTPNDNTGSTMTHTLSSTPSRTVVIEEGTGTWCGFCPRGKVAIEYMLNTYPHNTFIPIAVHNNDPMTVAAYDAGVAFSGFPSVNYDRTILNEVVDQTLIEQHYTERLAALTPASIAISTTVSGQQLTVALSAKFFTKISSALRFAAVVIEDSVTGTTSGYDQHNYYTANAYGPMGGFESLPNPVPAAQMVYDHVGRALIGGYTGLAGSITSPIADQQMVSHTFPVYNIPANFNKAHLSVAGFIIDNTGKIVNAVKTSLGSSATTSIENLNGDVNMNIFPNPFGESAIIGLNMKESKNVVLNVYNIMGELVYTENYGKLAEGNNFLNFNGSMLSNGIYHFNMLIGDRMVSKKVSIVK